MEIPGRTHRNGMSADARRTAYRLVLTGLLFWALAGMVYSVLRVTFGNRPAYIHVEWADTVDDSARQRLEARYSLALPEQKEGRTIAYALTDRSSENIRSLVLDPAVEDTHQIDRTGFQVLDVARSVCDVSPRGAGRLGTPDLPLFPGWARQHESRLVRDCRANAHSRARPRRQKRISRPTAGVASRGGGPHGLDCRTLSRRVGRVGRVVPDGLRKRAVGLSLQSAGARYLGCESVERPVACSKADVAHFR